MVIYLKHFLHGTKVAIAEEEAIADEKNGWVRYTPDEVKSEPEAPVNLLEVSRRRKQTS